jgi:hypothetical protein
MQRLVSQPLHLNVIPWFQSLLSNLQLVPLLIGIAAFSTLPEPASSKHGSEEH